MPLATLIEVRKNGKTKKHRKVSTAMKSLKAGLRKRNSRVSVVNKSDDYPRRKKR